MSDPEWRLPPRLSRLKDLAYNLWWSWHPEARALFKEIDRAAWARGHHNPVLLLRTCRERLETLSADPGFLARYDAIIRELDEYLSRESFWYHKTYPAAPKTFVAYFSAEFGVHNSLRIYSGGLGILAGDHAKSCSDLGVPLVGVGFMYPQGYVQQRIGVEGWQQNVYEQVDWKVAPVRPVMSPSGDRLVIRVSLGDWPLNIHVWQAQIGRVPLYLMDTNVEGNTPQDREISGRLYAGGRTMRLRQEIVLGIGGMRLLRALNIPAAVYHVNEGHSAFLLLERIRELAAAGKNYEDASREVSSTTVFTTHTPVAAGHDVFDESLIVEYFKNYWDEMGLDRESFLELGRVPDQEGWNMTSLALKLASMRNGVSARHGKVSRRMWTALWPEEKEERVPIGHITNGVHLTTWIQQDLSWLLTKHLGAYWKDNQDDVGVWSRFKDMPDSELWAVHQRNKNVLFNLIGDRARTRWMLEHAEPSQILAQGALLDPAALTIGFARRFAGYKRATLILREVEKLKALLLDPLRPVQLVFAGKAHPDDDSGKSLIQQVYRMAKDPAFAGRIAFIEDYDMHVARYFVQGCDLWLNNPQPPLEACGTSGIKAAVNGVPNLSVLDGWWEEGYTGANGWSIGQAGESLEGSSDASDVEDLYKILQTQIVPLFYDRGSDGVPHRWVNVMKESIATVAPRFSGNRMVKQYVESHYAPALLRQVQPFPAKQS